MRSQNALISGFAIFALLMAGIGCGDADSKPNPTLAAPRVLSVAPLTGSSGACLNSIVTATFNEAMNPATLNTGSFIVSGPGGAAVAGQVSYASSSNVATFTPTANLTPATLYTATLTTAVSDARGNGLAGNVAWTFTTGSTSCSGVGAPSVISEHPASAAVGACPNTVITAMFNEAMDPATIDAATFTVVGPSNAVVAGGVTYDASSNSAIFTPSVALAFSSNYTATITAGAHDLLGNSLPANFVWTFTTGAVSCQPPLPPVSVTPANGDDRRLLQHGHCSNFSASNEPCHH